MRNEIQAVDLAFVVDTTGSMGRLIAVAQEQMITMLRELTRAADIHLCLGIVEYRDHPPQDRMVSRVYAFTEDLQAAERVIKELQADGGGDGPEAVLDGITAACRELAWWRYARRLMVLVGDAPPHGVGTHGDAFSQGCPCGETIASVTRLAEEQRITIHSLGLTPAVSESFGEISYLTGGQFFSASQANQAIEHLASVLKMEFAALDLDRRVLALYRAAPEASVDELAQRLEISRSTAATSLVRLLSRELIEVPAVCSEPSGAK
jgi:Mg-chelatase subunit ChlD